MVYKLVFFLYRKISGVMLCINICFKEDRSGIPLEKNFHKDKLNN